MTPFGGDPAAARELVAFYHRNGYVRWPRLDRVDQEDSRSYKKGVELRFTANDPAEAARIMLLLGRVGLRHGRPFAKGHQLRIPVYGAEAVTRFLEMLERAEDRSPPGKQ